MLKYDQKIHTAALSGSRLAVLEPDISRSLHDPIKLRGISSVETAAENPIQGRSLSLSANPKDSVLRTCSSLALLDTCAGLISDSAINELRSLGQEILTVGVSTERALVKDQFSRDDSLVLQDGRKITLSKDTIEQVANALLQAREKEIFKVNLLGADNWRGLVPNRDKSSLDLLEPNERQNLRFSAYKLAINLALLPQEFASSLSVQLMQGLDSSAFLDNPVYKRATRQNFNAWKLRHAIQVNSGAATHGDQFRDISELSPANRYFSGLMGVGSFQMLRQLGSDGLDVIQEFSAKANAAGNIDHARLAGMLKSDSALTILPFEKSELYIDPSVTDFLAQSHHGIWLANRSISWMLPDKTMHQPYQHADGAHRPFEELSSLQKNQVSLQVLCLIASIGKEPEGVRLFNDLRSTCREGNPLELKPRFLERKL